MAPFIEQPHSVTSIYNTIEPSVTEDVSEIAGYTFSRMCQIDGLESAEIWYDSFIFPGDTEENERGGQKLPPLSVAS